MDTSYIHTLPFSDGSYKETNQTLQALEIYQRENLLSVNDIRPPRKYASVIISVRTCGVFRVYQDNDSGVPLPPTPHFLPLL